MIVANHLDQAQERSCNGSTVFEGRAVPGYDGLDSGASESLLLCSPSGLETRLFRPDAVRFRFLGSAHPNRTSQSRKRKVQQHDAGCFKAKPIFFFAGIGPEITLIPEILSHTLLQKITH